MTVLVPVLVLFWSQRHPTSSLVTVAPEVVGHEPAEVVALVQKQKVPESLT